MTTHVQQTLPFPWQGERHCSLQLLIQPWICAPGTQYGWVDRGSVEYEVCPTLLHMANIGNRTPDLLILSPTPYPLGHVLMLCPPFYSNAAQYDSLSWRLLLGCEAIYSIHPLKRCYLYYYLLGKGGYVFGSVG